MSDSNFQKENNKKIIVFATVRNTLVTVLCIAIGFLSAFLVDSFHEEDVNDDALAQISALQNQIIDLKDDTEQLKEEKNALQNRIDELDSKENQDIIQNLVDELSDVKTFAGLTKVTGKGICVIIDFPSSFSYSSVQSYLTLTINDLRASNAQAISINGERIIAMSELRVGSKGQISVNGRIISGPYEIHAIGDSSSLQSGMLLGGEGIIPIMQSKGAEVEWSIKNDIIIEACNTEDFKMDLMTPIE